MYNQVFLVGRLAQMPDYEIINNYRKDALIHIMVYRPFDEVKGCRDYDLVPIILWRGLAEMINDTCHVGSVIAVKGRLNDLEDKPDYQGYRVMSVRAESFEVLDEKLKELQKPLTMYK